MLHKGTHVEFLTEISNPEVSRIEASWVKLVSVSFPDYKFTTAADDA